MNAPQESPANGDTGQSAGTAAAPQLTPQQQAEYAAADQQMARLNRMKQLANFNAISLGAIAFLSVPMALFHFSGSGLFAVVAASILAYNEFRGLKRVKQLDAPAATFLGWNQVALLVCIAIYCLWRVYEGSQTDTKEILASLEQFPQSQRDMQDILREFPDFFMWLFIFLYGTVFVISLIFQGANAWYYFSRRRVITEIRDSMPEWILALFEQEAG